MLKIGVLLALAWSVAVQAGDQYYPCKSYISFSYDDSNSLSSNEFRTQMNFIQNVVETLNYPNRLRVEAAFTGEFNWNSGLSIQQMQSAIASSFQTSNQYSLLQQAASLLTSVEVLDNLNDPVAAVIFISDTSDAALKNVDRWFSKLGNVEITFIMLGSNVDSLKLRKLSKNFIYWPDLSEPQPDNWDLLFYHAFGFFNTTFLNIGTVQVSTVYPPTTSTSAVTPSSKYYPCRSNIVFVLDASSSIGYQEFKEMESLILDNVVTANWTHFNRIGLMSYANGSGNNYNYGTFDSLDGLKYTVANNITKYNIDSSIAFGMAYLYNTFTTVPMFIQNTIFFTSTSDPDDVANAVSNSQTIDFKGSLIVVAIFPAKKQDLLPLVGGEASKVIEFIPTSGISYDTYAAQILSKFYCSPTKFKTN